MSKNLEQVRVFVARGEVRVSLHGYEELAADNVLVHDIVDGLAGAVVVEDYPDYPKAPASSFWSKIEPISLFTSSGVSPRVRTYRLLWPPRIGLTPRNGTRRGKGGG